jgi:hypothetical protein
MPTYTNNTSPGPEHAIVGVADQGCGIHGISKAGPGVRGDADNGDGVFGFNKTVNGVHGMSESGIGVMGTSERGSGVWGRSKSSSGVGGASDSGAGVHGVSTAGLGVRGDADNGDGVFGFSKTVTGVHGMSERGVGVHGKGGRLAGLFEGDVEVTGNIRFPNAADCAEDFDIAGANSIEPGTVMVLGDDHALKECHQPYDKRVAGVISGAGDYKPGIVLGKEKSGNNRQPVALLGKVFCKVDANYGVISIGDLLTTSPTQGHAMKAEDPFKAFGAVIGKALHPLQTGQGLIPILIALQ